MKTIVFIQKMLSVPNVSIRIVAFWTLCWYTKMTDILMSILINTFCFTVKKSLIYSVWHFHQAACM